MPLRSPLTPLLCTWTHWVALSLILPRFIVSDCTNRFIRLVLLLVSVICGLLCLSLNLFWNIYCLYFMYNEQAACALTSVDSWTCTKWHWGQIILRVPSLFSATISPSPCDIHVAYTKGLTNLHGGLFVILLQLHHWPTNRLHAQQRRLVRTLTILLFFPATIVKTVPQTVPQTRP